MNAQTLCLGLWQSNITSIRAYYKNVPTFISNNLQVITSMLFYSCYRATQLYINIEALTDFPSWVNVICTTYLVFYLPQNNLCPHTLHIIKQCFNNPINTPQTLNPDVYADQHIINWLTECLLYVMSNIDWSCLVTSCATESFIQTPLTVQGKIKHFS